MMKYAMGGGRASWSRKGDLTMRIKFSRMHQGGTLEEVCESVKGYGRKKVAELEEIAKAEHQKALEYAFAVAESNSKISEKEWALIVVALKTSGLDPDDNMNYIGEQLTEVEYKKIYEFLKWLKATGKTVGHANYGKVFAEFLVARMVAEEGKDGA